MKIQQNLKFKTKRTSKNTKQNQKGNTQNWKSESKEILQQPQVVLFTWDFSQQTQILLILHLRKEQIVLFKK